MAQWNSNLISLDDPKTIILDQKEPLPSSGMKTPFKPPFMIHMGIWRTYSFQPQVPIGKRHKG